MDVKKWKIFSIESEPPQVFWPTYIIFVIVMIFLIYFSYRIGSQAIWALIILFVLTGISVPLVYTRTLKKKKQI